MRRSLHAAASIGSRIYVYGGIREGNYFDLFRIYLSIGNFAAFIFFTIFFCVGVFLDDLLISGELLSSGPTVPSFLWRSYIWTSYTLLVYA